MTYTLTDTQKGLMQGFLGIGSDESVFTDADLNGLFDYAGGNFDLTMVYAIDRLLIQASKDVDYDMAETAEKASQRFKQLQAMRDQWQKRYDEDTPGQQITIVGIRGIPPRKKDVPEGSRATDRINRKLRRYEK